MLTELIWLHNLHLGISNSNFIVHISELQQITERIDLPLYDIVTGNDTGCTNYSTPKSIDILDFESICAAELTPPQTPPQQQQESEIFIHAIYANEDQQCFDFQMIESSDISDCDLQNQSNDSSSLQTEEVYAINPDSSTSFDFNNAIIVNEDTSSTTYSSNHQPFADDMKFVDELVESHSRAQSVGRSETSPTWSLQSDATFSPRSECSGSSYTINDEPVRKVSRGITKRRSRSGRNPEEKKSRKKEQNKNAATRYRIKKKEEVHVIQSEEQILFDRNRKLSTTYKDTRREVKYLKSLLRELFAARGFIQL